MNRYNCSQNIQNNEKLLIKKAKKDPKYFAEIYNDYKPQIFSYILKKVNKRDIAQDLTSITFEKALKKLDYFQWEGVSFGSWLFRIARNTVYDHFRMSKRERKVEFEDNNFEEESIGMAAEILHDQKELELFKKISEFDKKDQYLLYYKYFVGMKNKQIAKKTGLSVSNVGTRLFRIRKKLRKLLESSNESIF